MPHPRTARPRGRRLAVATALLSLAALLSPAAAPTPAGAVTPIQPKCEPSENPNQDWFEPGCIYTGNFADPTVEYDAATGKYWAFAGITGGAHLPVAWSDNPTGPWRARPSYQPAGGNSSDPFFNDALVKPATWAQTINVNHPWLRKEVWAPGAIKIGSTWVVYYAVRTFGDRFCISYATSTAPDGPYYDNSSGPTQCDVDPNGSIDPEPFIDPADGQPYLIWKSEGKVGSYATRMWSRRLNANGQGFLPGSSAQYLLQTDPLPTWQGTIIENPSMIAIGGTYFLTYSGNQWGTTNYATGYAWCPNGPRGTCTNVTTGTPFLHSEAARGVWGPGGASNFTGPDGKSWLAYHYWNTSNPVLGSSQRKMRVDRLTAGCGVLAAGAARAPFPNGESFGCQQFGDFFATGASQGQLAWYREKLAGGSNMAKLIVDDFANQGPASIVRLYSAVFLRAPDRGGYEYWVKLHRTGGLSLNDVADWFISSSAEFKAQYGTLTNPQFIARVYQNVLEREPDQGGYDYWLNQMAHGLTRGQLMMLFSESPEYVAGHNVDVAFTIMLRRTVVTPADRAAFAGQSLQQIVATVLASGEYANRLPA